MLIKFTFAGLITVAAVAGHFEMGDERPSSWPTFRGPTRSAVAPDTDLLESWPRGGPKLLWTAEGAGRGYSSLAIAEGRIYTLGDGPSTADDHREYLLCFDSQSGRQLWKSATGSAWNNGKPTWQSSRSTPTVDDDSVYVLTAHGELICFSIDGDEKWKKNLSGDLSGKKADGWGYSESVLIDGANLICTPGGPRTTMAALDKSTGKTLWTTARSGDRGAGHSSIVISEVNGRKIYVQSTGSGPMGVDAKSGELLWTYDIERTTAVIPTPIVQDDLVFFSAGYGRGGALLKQTVARAGRVTLEEVYPLDTRLANKHGGVVLMDGLLFADSDSRGIPFCADLMTGNILWKSRGSGRQSASVVAADGHVYFRYSDGTMTLVRASSESFEEVGSFKIPGSGARPSWSHPVIFDGKLYLREGDRIHCYSIKA